MTPSHCSTPFKSRSTWVLQALREYQSDTFDDWRDLLEEQERRTRDELDASKVLPLLLCLRRHCHPLESCR